jgi:hypothetical protein
MRILFLFVVLLSSVNAFSVEPVLNYDGIGLIKFGMTLQDVESLIKEKATTQEEYSPEECVYVTFNGYKDVAFMVESNIVVRADVGESVKNSVGVKVGVSLVSIKTKFPLAEIKENFYDEASYDIYLRNPKGKGVILLSESEGKIQGVRAGIEPAVSYVEGCL